MLNLSLKGEAHGARSRHLSLLSQRSCHQGTTETGKQCYRCQQDDCYHRSFVLDPAYNGRLPQIKEQIINMVLNGSGIQDTARVLKISPTTVINELKKRVSSDLSQPAVARPLVAR